MNIYDNKWTTLKATGNSSKQKKCCNNEKHSMQHSMMETTKAGLLPTIFHFHGSTVNILKTGNNVFIPIFPLVKFFSLIFIDSIISLNEYKGAIWDSIGDKMAHEI